MMHQILFKSIYGSHLYGTNTPSSDMDYKQIHIESTDILLTGKYEACFNQNTNNGRNTNVDVDLESKELRHFIKEALSGQTYCLDLLFTPSHLILLSTSEWQFIVANRDKLLSDNIKPFIGYVSSQADKYSAKGTKITELQKVIAILEVARTNKIKTLGESIEHTGLDNTFKDESYLYFKTAIKYLNGDKGNKIPELYLHGPDCSFPCSRKLDEVLPVLQQKLSSFGRRAQEAATNNGVDLKAYYHALRVIWQLEDYLLTRELSFPSKRVGELLKVRTGQYSGEYVEDLIGSESLRVLEIPNNLPKPDKAFWDEWLLDTYMKQAHTESTEYLKKRNLL